LQTYCANHAEGGMHHDVDVSNSSSSPSSEIAPTDRDADAKAQAERSEAENVEVGGRGGNGRRLLAAPGRGGRPRAAVRSRCARTERGAESDGQTDPCTGPCILRHLSGSGCSMLDGRATEAEESGGGL